MLIQSKNMSNNTAIDKLREVLNRYRQQCDDRLTEALRDADADGREDLLYSDTAELELLDAQTEALRIALKEVQDADGNG